MLRSPSQDFYQDVMVGHNNLMLVHQFSSGPHKAFRSSVSCLEPMSLQWLSLARFLFDELISSLIHHSLSSSWIYPSLPRSLIHRYLPSSLIHHSLPSSLMHHSLHHYSHGAFARDYMFIVSVGSQIDRTQTSVKQSWVATFPDGSLDG